MIQIVSAKITEFRGIRELDFSPERRNFVVSGPNGSGKSGVVDAIQFGLTGEISRLSGRGTGTLSIQKHGPHVDQRDNPSISEVSLTLYFTDLDRTAVLTRNIKNARKFALSPDDANLRSVLQDVAGHPELSLSRREIIKYILVEATERSKGIQELLRLDEVGNLRSSLKTASNRVLNAYKTAQQSTEDIENELRRHLNVDELTSELILSVVNTHRQILGLSSLDEITPDTVIDDGVTIDDPQSTFNKETAKRDLDALKKAQDGFSEECIDVVESILAEIAILEDDPSLLEAIQQRTFVERGLDLVDGPYCPLCEMEWEDEEHLRKHLQNRLSKSKKAEEIQRQLLENSRLICVNARSIATLVGPVRTLASSHGPDGFETELTDWENHLTTFAQSLTTAVDVFGQKSRFEQDWRAIPRSLATNCAKLLAVIQDLPDQSLPDKARSFLAIAQNRMIRLRQVRCRENRARHIAGIGELTYAVYCEVSDEHLNALYEDVESDFSDYYREINGDDEREFRAKFEPFEGKLDFEVAFYNRGMFPPVAYHSEGHQDGMGVCLYLALMKRLLCSRFRFAVLDDVVMSVDHNHRKEFCKLLKSRFPDTQFIITTHDKIWATQMRTEGLIDRNGSLVFQNWSVETGPIFEQTTEVWDKIEADLSKNDTETAAYRLRRYLEYISSEVADQLGAKPRFRGDYNYDLGDLLPAVIGRHGELLKLAFKSATAWKNEEAVTIVDRLRETRSEVLKKVGGEQWVINKAIHFNDWASFSKSELQAVVAAFNELLSQFRCPNVHCENWYYVIPRKGDPEALRCRCGALNLNLRAN